MTHAQLVLETVPLFARLSKRHLASLLAVVRIAEFRPGDIIMAEGSRASGAVYVVVEGVAAALKKGHSPVDDTLVDYEVAVHGRHEVLGAVSLVDGEPLDFSVTAKTPLKVAILDFTAVASGPALRLKRLVIAEVRRHLVRHIRLTMASRVDTLRREAAFSGYRAAVGHSVVAALSLLSFYTLALSLLPQVKDALNVNFAVSPIVILSFAIFFLPVILYSGFPPAFFGIRLDNLRAALRFSLLASAAFLGVLVAVKAVLIALHPDLAGLTLVSFADVQIGDSSTMDWSWYLAALGIYALLTPLQEFVARCGIQAPLYAFLPGSEIKRHAWSILVSSLVFAAAHAHISLTFAVAAFIPGLFWGMVFARTNSLAAVSLSHIIVGGAGIFLFGIEEFVQKLT